MPANGLRSRGAKRADKQSNPASDGSARIAITYRAIDQLKPDANNPRVHSPKQIGQIAQSISAFGFNVPVLIDANDRVIGGHGRLAACRKLGWSVVPTICLAHLSDAQAKAFMIADNRLTDNSVWNERLLSEQLRALSVLDLDFSLEATGFDMGEIDLRIEGLSDKSNGAEDPADSVPPVASGPPVSQPGDLWHVGRHRILCGSALDCEAYDILMDSKRAGMVLTDPPYNVPIHGNVSGLGAIRHREFVMASGEMSEGQFTAFLTQACKLLALNSVDGSIHFLCTDWRHLGEVLSAGREIYSELKNVCVWVKTCAGMGSFYRSQHEFLLVYKHGGGSHRNNIQLGRHGRHRSNVWSYPSVSSFGRGTEEGNLLALHPTVKPVAMVADAILDCSSRGDIVLDSFVGSGTTVMAAERVGRRCYAMDLDPLYVDTAIRRWQAFTGDGARHAESGRTFDELAADKEASHGQ